MRDFLDISNRDELVRIVPEDILYIESDKNYSDVHLIWGEIRTFALQLGEMEELIENKLPESGCNFLRIGKKLIINGIYLSKLKPREQLVLLMDRDGKYYSLVAACEAVRELKNYLDGKKHIRKIFKKKAETESETEKQTEESSEA